MQGQFTHAPTSSSTATSSPGREGQLTDAPATSPSPGSPLPKDDIHELSGGRSDGRVAGPSRALRQHHPALPQSGRVHQEREDPPGPVLVPASLAGIRVSPGRQPARTGDREKGTHQRFAGH